MGRGEAQLKRKGNYGGMGRGTRRKAPALKEKPYHSITTKRGLKDALDAEVSLTVRENNPACVLCGESDWQKLTCGHLFKRTKEATRFDTHEGGNCNTLCRDCNGKDNEDHRPYVTWLKQTYGLRAYLELERRAKSNRRFEPYELRGMLEELRSKRRKKAA